MSKHPGVGTSHRTPVKHALMWEFISKERRAANAPILHYVNRLVWIDLTAGDGAPAYDAPWTEACSPGILSDQAVKSKKPVTVDLYEKNPETYATLLQNLAKYLPGLGYQRIGENQWRTGCIRVRATNQDGRKAYIEHISRQDMVLVLNDPNVVTDWAMDRRLLARIEGRSKGVRALSALGFNVGGGKRAPFERDTSQSNVIPITTRSEWYGLIEDIAKTLPRRHDLMIAKYKRDQAQWAYLFSSPVGWDSEEEVMVKNAFTAAGEPHDYEFAWYRKNPESFSRLIDQLILTKKEMRERMQSQLPLGELAQGGGHM